MNASPGTRRNQVVRLTVTALAITMGLAALASAGACSCQAMPEKPDSYFIKPSAVAEIAFQLTCQDRSAWSFEVEARPFSEHW